METSRYPSWARPGPAQADRGWPSLPSASRPCAAGPLTADMAGHGLRRVGLHRGMRWCEWSRPTLVTLPRPPTSAAPCRAIPWPAPTSIAISGGALRLAAREPLHSIPAERSLLLLRRTPAAPRPGPAPRVQGVWVSKQGLVLGPLARTASGASGVNSRRVRGGGAAAAQAFAGDGLFAVQRGGAWRGAPPGRSG